MYSFYTLKMIRYCQRGNASKAMDHCNSATRFKQVENQSRNHALRKRTRNYIRGSGNAFVL